MSYDEEINFKLGVLSIVMGILVLLMFAVLIVNNGEGNINDECIEGYINYYYYGYDEENKLVFELGVSTEAGNTGEKTVYVLKPGQKENILRYNTVNSKIRHYVPKKTIYEIRREE